MGAKQSLQLRNESNVPIHCFIIENGVLDLFSPIVAPGDTHTFVTKRKDYGLFDVIVDVADYDRSNDYSSRRYLEDKVLGLDRGMSPSAARIRGLQFQKGRCIVVDGMQTPMGGTALRFAAFETKKKGGSRSTMISDYQQTSYANRASMALLPHQHYQQQPSTLPLIPFHTQPTNILASTMAQPSNIAPLPLVMMPSRRRSYPTAYPQQFGYSQQQLSPWNQWGVGGQQYDQGQQQYGLQQQQQQPFVPLTSSMIVPHQQMQTPYQPQQQQQLQQAPSWQQQQYQPQQQWTQQQPQLQQQQLPLPLPVPTQQQLPLPTQQQQPLPFVSQQGYIPTTQQAIIPQVQQQQLPFVSQQGFLPGQQQKLTEAPPTQYFSRQIPFTPQQQFGGVGGVQQPPFQQQVQPSSLLQQGPIPIQHPQLTNVVTQPQQLIQEKGIYQTQPFPIGQQQMTQQQQQPMSSMMSQPSSSLMSGGSTQTVPYNTSMMSVGPINPYSSSSMMSSNVGGGQQQQYIPQQQQSSLFPGQQQMFDKQLLASTGQQGNVMAA